MKKIEKGAVVFDTTSIPSTITIWTAGFANVGTCYLRQEYCGQTGRILVDKTLRLIGHSGMYAVGDIVSAYDEKTNEMYPQMGEFANRSGQYVAQHIVNSLRKKMTPPFSFSSRGIFIPIC